MKNPGILRTLAALPFIGILSWAAAEVAIPQPRAFVLTAQENGLDPQDSFSCSGTIHGYITFPKAEIGQHVLEGTWILPNGKVLEETEIPIDFPPPGRQIASLWLTFRPPSARIFGGVNPQADEERLAYNGRWRLEVRWDNQWLLSKNFNVRCS
jgi:hypothetical protein